MKDHTETSPFASAEARSLLVGEKARMWAAERERVCFCAMALGSAVFKFRRAIVPFLELLATHSESGEIVRAVTASGCSWFGGASR